MSFWRCVNALRGFIEACVDLEWILKSIDQTCVSLRMRVCVCEWKYVRWLCLFIFIVRVSQIFASLVLARGCILSAEYVELLMHRFMIDRCRPRLYFICVTHILNTYCIRQSVVKCSQLSGAAVTTYYATRKCEYILYASDVVADATHIQHAYDDVSLDGDLGETDGRACADDAMIPMALSRKRRNKTMMMMAAHVSQDGRSTTMMAWTIVATLIGDDASVLTQRSSVCTFLAE